MEPYIHFVTLYHPHHPAYTNQGDTCVSAYCRQGTRPLIMPLPPPQLLLHFTLEYIFDVTLVFLAHPELQKITAGHIMQCCKPAIRQGEALVRGDSQTPKGLGRAQCGMCSFAFGGGKGSAMHTVHKTWIYFGTF